MMHIQNIFQFIEKYAKLLFFTGIGMIIGLALIIMQLLVLEMRSLSDKIDIITNIEKINQQNIDQDRKILDILKNIEDMKK